MGCHTWFYAKDKEITDTEVKESIIKEVEETINHLLNTIHEVEGNEEEEVIKEIKYNEKLLRHLNNGKIGSRKTLSKLFLGDTEEMYHDGHIYKQVGYHDLFRIGGYPEDILSSKEETYEFINKKNIKEVSEEKLNEFWDLNPNGLIIFG